MKLKYTRVKITMERVQAAVTKSVPAWEVPVIQAIHPDTEIVKDIVIDTKPPSVADEYERLSQAYGAERLEGGTAGPPYIEGVYGKGALGVAELKRAMQSCVLPKSTPVTPPEAPPQLRKDLLQALSSDSVDDLIGDTAFEAELIEPVDEEITA